MKKRYLAGLIVPLFAFAALGVQMASAHGWGFASSADPAQIAEAQTQAFEKQAALLGISVEEYKNLWAQGKNFAEIAKEKGVSQDQLRQKMQELMSQKMKAHLDALVAKGVITQNQADQRLEAMKKNQQNGKAMKMRGMRMGEWF